MDGLTVTRGNGLLRGGGIRNDGTLTLSDAVVSDNVVVGLPGVAPATAALGGGIYNSGALTVLRTTFARNQVLRRGRPPGRPRQRRAGRGHLLDLARRRPGGFGRRQPLHVRR